MPSPSFARRTLADLTIEDERSFRHVALYDDLKQVLLRDAYSFRILPDETTSTWDRALFLNLTFWGASEGGDVLVDETVPADVVAHVAWHHLATKALSGAPGTKPSRPSVQALFLGEAIASAFDLYLVGRLLGHSPKSEFLASQVPAISEATESAGLSEAAFEAMLEGVAADPEAAFASLRTLLVEASTRLYACVDAEEALAVLRDLESHRFGSLLHRYELANWVLYARAYGHAERDEKAEAIERALRDAAGPVQWLVDAWVKPALA